MYMPSVTLEKDEKSFMKGIVRAEIMTSKLWIYFTILFSELKNVYDNDDNLTVIYTTTNQMAASFRKLCELEKWFLVLFVIIWV